MSTAPDSQTVAISSGLKKLQDLLKNPVAMSALELDKNARAAAQYSILKRLSKSLLQYIERDGTLFYVGLIGHFSAGKTSSINSLLQTWKTASERKTDFHPTDKTITLITREKNADSLLGVIQEGHVPIRLQKIENSLLDQIVLVDTPGTGDPEFFEEVARDFLPICDVILFLFSAASPLDASDVPLLNELHSRLPFIPLHFVVTRADELRINSDQPLTEANFDNVKANRFLDSAISRINTLLAPQIYQNSSFTFIDNRSQFRLDQLRVFIANKCDASNTRVHISMHMNKLQFYLESAKELREFFSGILDYKLMEVSKIVDAASRNIARYQEIVQISNSNLTKTWFEAASEINKSSARSNEELRAPEVLPADFGWFPFANNKRNEIAKDIDRDAKFAARTIALGARASVINTLRGKIYELEKLVAETAVAKLSATEQNIEPPATLIDIREADMTSSANLLRRYNELRDAEANALRDAAGNLRRLIKELDDAVSKGSQLVECVSIIEDARSLLKADLDKFFHNVELYRTGVFSLTTKEAISTLGIGSELDQLEKEFTAEDKQRFTSEATLQLFPDVDEMIKRMGDKFGRVSEKAAPLIEAARGLKLDRGDSPARSIQDALNLAREALGNDLTQGLQADAAHFCSELNLKISKAIVEAKSRYDSRVYHFRRERRHAYLTASGLAAIVWGLGWLAFRHHERAAPKSAVGELALGILAGLILQGGTVLFVRW